MIKWLATFIIIWFIYEVRSVFPPIIVGAIIAYLLLPLVQQLSASAKISVGMATTIVYFLVAAVLITTLCIFGPVMGKQVGELASNAHGIILNVVRQFADVTHWQGDVETTATQILNNLADTFGKPTEIAHLGGLLSHGMLAVLVCVVSSIYFTVDSDKLGRFFLRYLPSERRETAIELTGQMNKLLSRYVQGQLFLILFMSVVAWLFLHFGMNMKFAFPVAIISGFLEIIPVLGPILAISTATLVGIWQFGAGALLPIVGFYWIARLIEDYIVVPKVIGHAVELHPLAVIFAVLCGEHMAGALGMLIAIPVAACIKLFIDFFYLGKTPPSDTHRGKGRGAQEAPGKRSVRGPVSFRPHGAVAEDQSEGSEQ